MPDEERLRDIVDAIIWMTCDRKPVNEIAEALRIPENAVNAVVSRLDIIRF